VLRYKSLSPRACFLGRIWCDSKADSIVWMGEDGGLATFKNVIFERFLSNPSKNSPSSC
jgi:hypothetical protein